MDAIALFHALALFGASIPEDTLVRPIVERAMNWREFTKAANRYMHPLTGATLGKAPTYARLEALEREVTKARGISAPMGHDVIAFASGIFHEFLERLPVTHAPEPSPEALFAELTEALAPEEPELDSDADARLEALIDDAIDAVERAHGDLCAACGKATSMLYTHCAHCGNNAHTGEAYRAPVFVGDEGARLPSSLPISTE